MLNGSVSARTGRRLYGSVADAVLAMAYDDQLPGLAQRYDLQAIPLSQVIGDRGRITRVQSTRPAWLPRRVARRMC